MRDVCTCARKKRAFSFAQARKIEFARVHEFCPGGLNVSQPKKDGISREPAVLSRGWLWKCFAGRILEIG